MRCFYNVGVRNGAIIDPLNYYGNPNGEYRQALDGRDGGWLESGGTRFPRAFTTPGIESLLLTKSRPEIPTCNAYGTPGWIDHEGQCSRSVIESAEVLTAVDAIPFLNEMRPGYPGSTKVRYFWDDQRAINLFMNLNPAPVLTPAPPAPPAFAEVYRNVNRLWFVHLEREGSRNLSPSLHQPNYGADMARYSGLALWVLARSDISQANKLLMAKQLTQIGIDQYHALLAGLTQGPAWTGWEGANGHSGIPRWAEIVLAGVILNNPAMRDVFLQSSMRNKFGPLCHAYYDSPGEMNTLGVPNMPVLDASNHCGGTMTAHPIDRATYGNYFFCCTWIPWTATVGAMRVLGLERYFGNTALFDLVQRAYREDNAAFPSGHGSPWADFMWGRYADNTATTPELLCGDGAQQRCYPGGCVFNQTTPGLSTMHGENLGPDNGAACQNGVPQ